MKNIFLARRFFFTLVFTGLLNGCATEASTADAKGRLATARALFSKRCETAGEKIHRTVDEVEGVILLKLREKSEDVDSQFVLDDQYGNDLNGTGYISTFLRGSYQASTKGTPRPGSPPRLGYLYTDAINPKDGIRYRYTGGVREHEVLSSIIVGGSGKMFKTTEYVVDGAPTSSPMPRYGVTYDDISTRQEREYWIAGSSLKIIDLNTNEVIAERIGYMMDMSQGDNSGGRAPWLFASDHACPSFTSGQAGQAQIFVEKVLHPALIGKK